ncbi:hypothetical protein RJ640_005478 [Escallonia rubra]|uniref:Gnk2-homologous domain-containing protein n=1 Tax=Escallonia rubra TaxID=112253 RepID=A0AA88RWH9_9ASTE|nr:hypothetical protein RJ640_005478 [Escallonia rubra]
MATQGWVLILYHTFLHLVCLTIAQPELLGYTCADTGNYTRDSAYSSNLDDVIYSLSINTTNFSSVSAGSDPDSVNGIALCRGDINQDVCRRCVDDSTRRLRQLCTDQKEAIGWYDDCMVRYSDRSIYQSLETSPYSYLVSDHTAPDVGTFNKALGTLLGSLRYEAAQGGSALKFASGNVSAPKNVTIYALVQCTPDLTAQQCDNCLKGTSWCCDGYTGARYQNPSCNIGYALTQFYNVSPAAAPPAAARQALPPPGTIHLHPCRDDLRNIWPLGDEDFCKRESDDYRKLHQVKVSSIDLLQMYQLCQAKVQFKRKVLEIGSDHTDCSNVQKLSNLPPIDAATIQEPKEHATTYKLKLSKLVK